MLQIAVSSCRRCLQGKKFWIGNLGQIGNFLGQVNLFVFGNRQVLYNSLTLLFHLFQQPSCVQFCNFSLPSISMILAIMNRYFENNLSQSNFRVTFNQNRTWKLVLFNKKLKSYLQKSFQFQTLALKPFCSRSYKLSE